MVYCRILHLSAAGEGYHDHQNKRPCLISYVGIRRISTKETCPPPISTTMTKQRQLSNVDNDSSDGNGGDGDSDGDGDGDGNNAAAAADGNNVDEDNGGNSRTAIG